MPIKILSSDVINKIAAGEVVEKPMSVIKELLENAIDAGATAVTIDFINHGFSTIRVADNGSGMSKEDLELSVIRHATSKLNEDNIYDIKYMGFRGEALPSIASVSDFNIISKLQNSSDAWELSMKFGMDKVVKPASRAAGTTIEINNLFQNLPIKLKFLKAPKSEYIASLELINRVAIAHPLIEIIVNNNEKRVVHYSSHKGEEAVLARIAEIFTPNFKEHSRKFHVEHEDFTISGYASLATYNRNTTSQQLFYVNKRFVRDKFLLNCMRAAYQGLIAEGRHSSVVLFIEIKNELVDVNVHPTKMEIRFRDERLIKDFIVKGIREAIKNIVPTRQYESGPEIKYMSYANTFDYSKSQYQYQDSMLKANEKSAGAFMPNSFQQKNIEIMPVNSNILERKPITEASFFLGLAFLQLDKKYILSKTNEDIIIIDQHAAHERLVLEKMKRNFFAAKLPAQNLLMPLVIDLNQELLDLVLEAKEKLQKFGLNVEAHGNRQVLLRSVPNIFGGVDPETLINDIAEHLSAYGNLDDINAKAEEILGNIACHSSIRAGKELNVIQMNTILREMERVEYAGQCNHGRPTYIKLSDVNLDKIFLRK